MVRKKLLALMMLLALVGSACSTPAMPPGNPTPEPPSQNAFLAPESNDPEPSDPTLTRPVTTTPGTNAERILAVLSPWGPAADANWAPTWAGVDANGQLVLGGPEHSKKREKLQEPVRWFADRLVDRIILWSGYPNTIRPTDTHGSISKLSRQTYQQWPLGQGFSLPFDVDEWSTHMDAYAERNDPLLQSLKADMRTALQRWFQERLGDRLVELTITDQEQADYDFDEIKVVVKPATNDRQGRIEEVALLSMVPVLYYAMGPFRVEYQGDATPRVFETGAGSMTAWFGEDGVPENLAGWMTIDGVRDESLKRRGLGEYHSTYSSLTTPALESLLESRSKLEAILPPGTNLIIGQDRGSDGIVAIEGVVPESWTQDQEWLEYQRIVDQLFAQSPYIEDAYLILRRGNQVEFMDFWSRHWKLRGYVLKTTGADPQSISFPLAAQWYDRFTVVKP